MGQQGTSNWSKGSDRHLRGAAGIDDLRANVGATTVLTIGIADPLRSRTMGTAADASASEFETHLLSQPSSAEAPAPLTLRRYRRAREAHGVRCASLYRGLGADSAERAPLYKDEGIRGETGRPRLSEERFAGSWAAWRTYSVTWPERNWPLAPTVGSRPAKAVAHGGAYIHPGAGNPSRSTPVFGCTQRWGGTDRGV